MTHYDVARWTSFDLFPESTSQARTCWLTPCTRP
jgi:hypothetical protein